MGMAAYADALTLPPGAAHGVPVRVALVVAHPDDEAIGAGGLLLAAGGGGGALDLRLLHFTDGAPRQADRARQAAVANRRRQELAAALAVAGIPPECAQGLGVVDQEAALHLAALSRTLADRLAGWRADVVLTHAYEGGHPDHDAAAFAVRAACDLLVRAGHPAPRIVEMPFYHAEDGRMVTQAFLPGGEPGRAVRLDAGARDAKRRMFAAHASQADVLAAFAVEEERFRAAPRYAFVRPPHLGPLLYETWGFAMTGMHWRLLADEALADLGLEGARWL